MTITEANESDLIAIDYRRLQSIARCVQLESIVLLGVNFESYVDPRSPQDDALSNRKFVLKIVDARWYHYGALFEAAIGYELLTTLERKDENNRFPAEFVALGAPADALFRLTATWVATYTLPQDFQWPEDHEEVAADFVIANGQLNMFPFLRRLVVDVTAEGGWSSSLLPVFRVPKHRTRGLVRNLSAWAQNQSPK